LRIEHHPAAGKTTGFVEATKEHERDQQDAGDRDRERLMASTRGSRSRTVVRR